MITLLTVSAAITLSGTAALVIAMLNAPEGYEDETGFHFVWANNSPEVADIACVWVCGVV